MRRRRHTDDADGVTTLASPEGQERPASLLRRLPIGPSDAPLVLVVVAIAFNLWFLRDQVHDVLQLNDNSIHASMVRWAEYRIRAGHLPFDGWYPYLSQGASRFHHYQSLPHILTGALSVVLGEWVFRWILYLGISCWPLAVYLGARLFDLDPWAAGVAALVSPLVVSRPGLGYEWSSYTWGGSGTWTQLWGMWALPLAWGFSWRAVAKRRSLAIGALAVGLTVALHLLTGYLAMLTLGVWVLIRPGEWRRRLGRAAIVGIGALAVSSFMLVPLVTDRAWAVQDEFSRGTFYYDSFGARKVLGWLFSGQLFDSKRVPLVSLLVGAGLVLAIGRSVRDERWRAILGAGLLSLLLFFGRPTLGPALKLLPGGSDLFLRRYIFGVHLAGIFLAGAAGAWLGSCVIRLYFGARGRFSAQLLAERGLVATAAFTGIVLFLTPFAVMERVQYARRDAGWIADQAVFDATDGVHFGALVARANQAADGRVFAGRRPAKSPAVGAVPGYAALLDLDADGVGFTRPTWSLMSPSEYRFQASRPVDYELFGARYIITRSPPQPPVPATLVAKDGAYALWRVDDVGYMDVVDTIAPIVANRTNIGQQMSSFLSSGLIAKKMFPTVSFGGRPAAAPTLGPNRLPADAPGTVSSVTASPADGVFSGQVEAARPAVVLLKASFDPRWTATVDGVSAPTQMLAPGFVGVAVPAGHHGVTFAYRSYPLYWLWLATAAVGLLVLGALDLRGRYRGAHARREEDRLGPEPAVLEAPRD